MKDDTLNVMVKKLLDDSKLSFMDAPLPEWARRILLKPGYLKNVKLLALLEHNREIKHYHDSLNRIKLGGVQ